MTKQHSEDLQKEFSHLECLKLQMVIKHGLYDKGCKTRGLLSDLKGSDGVKKINGWQVRVTCRGRRPEVGGIDRWLVLVMGLAACQHSFVILPEPCNH
jgi:hypothetical protein